MSTHGLLPPVSQEDSIFEEDSYHRTGMKVDGNSGKKAGEALL